MPDYRGLRTTVMGLGAFGGGEGAVRFLAQRGARVTVTDLRSADDLQPTLDRLQDVSVERWRLGGHDEADFREADLVVVNPAVPRDCPFLAAAQQAHVPLTSEMNLFWTHRRGRLAAVTGTIGKSTTTALLERMLAASGRRTWLGGNIGRSLLPVIDEIRPDDWVVLELSSFQLADLDSLRPRIDAAVVTNFFANHLDWHASLADYRIAKQTILRWQQPEDVAVLNADDSDVSGWPGAARRLWFGATRRGEGAALSGPQLEVQVGRTAFSLDLRECFRLPGGGHALNAAAAAACAVAVGAGEVDVRKALHEFPGLPHRMEFLGEHRGVRFYNDSKATTPEAAIAALDAAPPPVILLAGGSNKGVDLGPFAAAISARVKAVALLGDTGPMLDRLLAERTASGAPLQASAEAAPSLGQSAAAHASSRGGAGGKAGPARFVAPSFDAAVQWVLDRAAPGDSVVLSPGCASFGWFRNYAERGERFAALVQQGRRTFEDQRG